MRNFKRILAACALSFLILGFFWVANVPWVIASNIQVGFPVLARTSTNGNNTYANSTGALTPGDCVSIDANLNFIDSGVAGCGGSGAGKGGIVVYSAASLSLSGTQFVPIGGGGLPSGTETNVDASAPSAATVTNFDVQISAAPGVGNSIVFTWRKNAVSQALTCTISGAVATSCNDSTHSFLVAQGDLLSIQLVTTGVIAGTPNLVLTTQFGTTGSNGTVNTATQFQIGEYLANGTAISGVTVPNSPNGMAFNSATGVFTALTAGAGQLHSIGFVIDGGGSAIVTGDAKVYPTADFACTINRVDISADQSGSITVDVWKRNAAIPTSGQKISASAPLTLSAAQLAQSGSLTGWTTAVSTNDVFGFSVATVATVTRVTGQIWCQ
jgi:fibronectin-binding autotransporter adhesin